MRKNIPSGWYFIIFVIVVIAIWCLNLFLLKGMGSQDRGTFGDMFGVANSIFSGLAFSGVAYSIILQRHEIFEQKVQIKSAMQDAEETKRIQEQQRFENTFFELIRLHHVIVNSMYRIAGGGHRVESREILREIYDNKIINKFGPDKMYPSMNKPQLERIASEYAELYRDSRHLIDNYFRHMFGVLNFVDQSGIGNKKSYFEFYFSQLSGYEIALLFYHVLAGFGPESAKLIIEKYALFDCLDFKIIAYPSKHIPLYSALAYGNKDTSEYSWN